MSDTFQLRHYDYVLQIPTLDGGQQARYPLVLDTDSSFILRGRAVYAKVSSSALLTSYFDRYTGPDNDDLSDSLTRFAYESSIYGQFGLALPVRPPVIYPPGSTIYVDVQNTADPGQVLSGLEIYFRGQKIFAPGVLPCYTYPPKSIMRPYQIPFAHTMTLQQTRLNNIMRANSYADFVVRSLSIGSKDPQTTASASLVNYREAHIMLKDMDGRTYSNVPVHVDVCFGAFGSLGPATPVPNATIPYGNYLPPLFTPEIYVPATSFLMYDLYRSDVPWAEALFPAVEIKLNFSGVQVWR